LHPDLHSFPTRRSSDLWIRAVDPANGKLLWKFDCNPKDAEYELAGRGTRSDFIATPVIYKNRVYIGVGQDPEHNPGVGHLWCIEDRKSTRLNSSHVAIS